MFGKAGPPNARQAKMQGTKKMFDHKDHHQRLDGGHHHDRPINALERSARAASAGRNVLQKAHGRPAVGPGPPTLVRPPLPAGPRALRPALNPSDRGRFRPRLDFRPPMNYLSAAPRTPSARGPGRLPVRGRMSWIREADQEPIPGYRLIRPLGSGGFGEVWLCEAPGKIHKAIKFVFGNLDAAAGDGRARQEFHALQQVKEVRHPFVLSHRAHRHPGRGSRHRHGAGREEPLRRPPASGGRKASRASRATSCSGTWPTRPTGSTA